MVALAHTRSVTPRIPLILDCDPGHDDALAIIVALARPELELLAVTTVAGNAGLDATTRNALRVLTLAGRTDIPVAAGAARPLQRELHVAANVHGASGLAGADLPEPAAGPRSEGAIELIRSVLEAAPEPVTIAAVGPLTNVALLLRTHPELAGRIASIRVMGGAVTEGNTTASAEFNIWQDPEAAQIVLDCGRPITLMTLDVTHQALFTAADVERLEALGTRIGTIFADLLRYFSRFHAERYGWDGSPIHDAVTVAHLAVPDLVRTVAYRVDVETTSELTRGRTVVDLHGLTGKPANADVGVAIDRSRFIDLLVDAVATVGSALA
jgi:pyrimidine-specific ribonucleoside hydrolase